MKGNGASRNLSEGRAEGKGMEQATIELAGTLVRE